VGIPVFLADTPVKTPPIPRAWRMRSQGLGVIHVRASEGHGLGIRNNVVIKSRFVPILLVEVGRLEPVATRQYC
jgi:hypothetical protein